MRPLTICIGYDSREPIALDVCAHSIVRRASGPVSIVPLALNHLKGIYTREPNGTTEFSLTRFLTPYMSNYEGVSVFMDCDFLVRCDIFDVVKLVEENERAYRAECEQFRAGRLAGEPAFDSPAVWCCQHDYSPREGLKATGVQTTYARKNWSSFMVFNNQACRTLTPEYVNTASPADLHRMVWAGDRVGALPLDFNWLVAEYEPKPDARILHYTLGTPCFESHRHGDHADLWFEEYAHMNAPLVTPEYGQFAVAKAASYPVPPIGSRA